MFLVTVFIIAIVVDKTTEWEYDIFYKAKTNSLWTNHNPTMLNSRKLQSEFLMKFLIMKITGR